MKIEISQDDVKTVSYSSQMDISDTPGDRNISVLTYLTYPHLLSEGSSKQSSSLDKRFYLHVDYSEPPFGLR